MLRDRPASAPGQGASCETCCGKRGYRSAGTTAGTLARLACAVLRRLLGGALQSALRATRGRMGPRTRGSGEPELSIIVCSVDEARFARCSANWREMLSERHYELIRIADARGLAEGYNRGLALSRADVLVFCHDDIEILQPNIYSRLTGHLQRADLIGIAGTSRLAGGSWFAAGRPDVYGQVVQPPLPTQDGCRLELYGRSRPTEDRPIQALDGVFLAMRRGVAKALRFDAERFDGFHLYDLDFTFRAYLAGFRLAVCHDVLIYHQSRGDWGEDWRHYVAVFEKKFAGRLSGAPLGRPDVRWIAAHNSADALARFEQLLREEAEIWPNI